LDYDNDGWSDILMVNGHLSPEIDVAGSDSHFRQRKLLFRNLGNGHFADVSAEVGAALSAPQSSRGAAIADLLNDGRLSVAVNELHERPSLLLLQQKPPAHWIAIKTVGMRSNRDGIGARAEVRAGSLRQFDEVRSGGGYLSQNDLCLHFGLGNAAMVDELTISWPSGIVDRWTNIPADQRIVAEEGAKSWRSTNLLRNH
jgi:hypothetical protein